MSLQTYDFIFSLGAACSCTQALRLANFQHASYPFDWLCGSQLSTRVDLILNNFEHFIDLSSLSHVGKTISIKCDTYYNKDNDLTFNHDFLTEVPLPKMYPAVVEKYNRRITRLLDALYQARRILAVYIEAPHSSTCIKDDELISAVTKLQQKYPGKQIDLCYIAADTNLPRLASETTTLTPHILKITANYTSMQPTDPPHVADLVFLSHLLHQFYKLDLPFSFRLKQFCIKCAIQWFVPSSTMRKKLRKYYHINP